MHDTDYVQGQIIQVVVLDVNFEVLLYVFQRAPYLKNIEKARVPAFFRTR